MEEPIVYTMQAHGCETDEVLKIPPGCIYVTFADCGLEGDVTSDYEKMLELFQSDSPWLKDPVQYKNHIESYINEENIKNYKSIRHIHIHTSDSDVNTYHNLFYLPNLSWSCNSNKGNRSPPAPLDSSHTHAFYLKSGLYTPGIPLISDHDVDEPIDERIFIDKSKIKLSQLIEIYDGSLLPDLYKIVYYLDEMKGKPLTDEDDITYDEFERAYLEALNEDALQIDEKRPFSSYITQEELFKKYPGIYYNLACRINCEGDVSPKQGLRRKQSFESYESMTKLSADEGNRDAQYMIATMYYHNDDKPNAFRYYKLAADQGDRNAQYITGKMYFNGEGIEENKLEAVNYYQLAAAQGDDISQFNLGAIYFTGNGVPQDKSNGVKYYQLAAAQGDMTAQFNLGVIYSTGNGVPQNQQKALKYYQLAAAQGHPKAQSALEKLKGGTKRKRKIKTRKNV
jgi:TPR repeat protein